ncbi:MAG TPA: hypothetical protein VF796_26485 [Humisphaera sp.]
MTNNTDNDVNETTTALATAAATPPAKPATSAAKVAANRRNALKSTGPTSAAGKARVAVNAVRHGLLSWRPVLPHGERPEDWDAHLARTLASLAPDGHLEAVLAERVALLLWRLDRVARYEREAAAADQVDGTGAGAEDAAAEAKQYEAVAAVVDAAADADDDGDPTPVPAGPAVWVVETAVARAGVELYEDEDDDGVVPVPEPAWAVGDVALVDLEWTAGRVREYVAAVAKHAQSDADEVWRELAEFVASKVEAARAKAERAERHRRAHLLPPDRTLAKVARYEAGLERSLYRALHELQRLQQARAAGVPVTPPAAVEVEVNGMPDGGDGGAGG